MPVVKVNLKWTKQTFENVELDKDEPVETFKAQAFAITGVPVDRQKLMAKGAWKGFLKDDAKFSEMEKLIDGCQIVLMGSADVVKAPEKKTVFVEDMSSAEITNIGAHQPAGLVNLGNTCYMNSVLQCIRYVPELREGIKGFPGGITSDLSQSFTTSLRDTYTHLDRSVDSIPPVLFVDTLRKAFPQFAQQGPRGGYMQQDSEEFLATLFSTLSQNLKGEHSHLDLGGADSLIDALFGLEIEETLTCTETDAEEVIVKREKSLKLVCNITKDINHMSEGIKLGLDGTIEKQSEVLGRNAIWKKTLRVNKLPRYLCVQFMRFYWKLTPDSRDHSGVKCKMLRPISFPMILDVFEFCSAEEKLILKVERDKNAEKILNEFKEKGKAEEKEGHDVEMKDADDEKKALDAAIELSMAPNRNAGIGVPQEFMGNYELFGVVTHKGRSADSGHYIGWARENKDDWLCFDDDQVSSCKSEDIQKLKGGGDWHMAYLAFYRIKD